MGLDNGIVIKPKTEKGMNFLETYFYGNKETYYTEPAYEFAYFRKCWNIRARFFEIYSELKSATVNKSDYYFNFAIEDIPTLIKKVFKYFLIEENWEYDGVRSQVFSWEVELSALAETIRDLRLFYEYAMDSEDGITDADVEIYFYDSY